MTNLRFVYHGGPFYMFCGYSLIFFWTILIWTTKMAVFFNNLMPSSHCMILAPIFSRRHKSQKYFLNQREIGARSGK